MATKNCEKSTYSAIGAGISAVEVWLAAERHQLLLFAPVMLGVGISAYFILPGADYWIAVILFGAAMTVSGLVAQGLLRRVLIVGGALIALGVIAAWWRTMSVAAPVLEKPVFAADIVGTVVGMEDLPARGRTRLLLRNIKGHPQALMARISLRGQDYDAINVGDSIRLRASLMPPPGPNVPGGYHFARRAWYLGIGASGYALSKPVQMAAVPVKGHWYDAFEAFRRGLTRRLQTAVGDSEGGVAAALVTGDRGAIGEQATQAMRDSGLAHLIAISGLHIAAVVGGVLFVTRRLFALSTWLTLRFNIKILAAICAAVAGIGYTLLAGASVPTIRACLAVLIVLIGLAAGREAISLRLVAAGAFVILLLRPEYLLGPSFQLSFAAVAGIVALYQSPVVRRFSRKDEDRSWYERAGYGVLALIATGLVAELALGPIALYHFNQMGFYGVFANLVAIPLTSFVILPLLALALLLDPLGLAGPVFGTLHHAIGLLLDVAKTTAGLPGAVARLPTMPDLAFGAIIVGGIWLVLWQGRRRWLGLIPVGAGMMGAAFAEPPSLIIDGDGHHVAIVQNGRLALLRPRAGDYVRSMWEGAGGFTKSGDMDALPAAKCSPDSCIVRLKRNEGHVDVLATRSKMLIDRSRFEPACRAADIVVSDRRLPVWCAPRWLKFDRAALQKTGAVAIWLDKQKIRTVAADDGDHPWATSRIQ